MDTRWLCFEQFIGESEGDLLFIRELLNVLICDNLHFIADAFDDFGFEKIAKNQVSLFIKQSKGFRGIRNLGGAHELLLVKITLRGIRGRGNVFAADLLRPCRNVRRVRARSCRTSRRIRWRLRR